MLILLLLMTMFVGGLWLFALVAGAMFKLLFTLIGGFASLIGGAIVFLILAPILILLVPILLFVALLHVIVPIALIGGIVWLLTRDSRRPMRTA